MFQNSDSVKELVFVEYLDLTQVLEVIQNLGAFTSLVYTLWSLWDKIRSLSRKRTKTCRKIQ